MTKDLDLYAGNPMPESVRDRPSSAHEHLFLFSKSSKYFYDYIAAKEASVSDPPSGNGFKRQARLSYKGANVVRGNEDQCEMTPKRNLRNVWCIPTKPFRGTHFATAPEALVTKCIEIGTSAGGCCVECGAPLEQVIKKGWKATCECEPNEPIPCTVLDPFMGAATTALVAEKLGRNSIGIELNPEYAQIAEDRLAEYTRETYDQLDEHYIPLESEDEIPEEVELSELFGK